MAPQLCREALRQADDTVFRRRIRGESGGGNDRLGRRDVDNASAADGLHVRHNEANEVCVRTEVHRKGCVPSIGEFIVAGKDR